MDKRGGPVAPDLAPNRDRNEHPGKIGEQVQRTDFIEVNERAGIADDHGGRLVSRCHEGPSSDRP